MIATSSPYFKSDVALNGHSLFIRIEYQEITANEENYFSKALWFYEALFTSIRSIYLSTWHFLFYKPYYTAVEPKELERVYLFKLYDLLKKLV